MNTFPLETKSTCEKDIPIILEISNLPEVARHQYQRSLLRSGSELNAVINNQFSTDDFFVRCRSIFFEKKLVGVVLENGILKAKNRHLICGWNLHPDFWGYGIMTKSLRSRFANYFMEEDFDYVQSECFRTNQRCKRLLRRLEFQPQRIRWLDRIQSAWRSHCYRWVLRFKLTNESWQKANSTAEKSNLATS